MTLKKRKTNSEVTQTSEEKTNSIVEEDVKVSKTINQVTDTSKIRRCWDISVFIVKGLLLLMITPCFLNFAALIREEKEFKPEGVTTDVNEGQKLFRRCSGSGSPTVLFDAPLGQSSDVWYLIETSLAKMTKVCVYDRAGLGYSDRVYKVANESRKAGKSYTAERMVEDFHQLFEKEEKPFVLVGADLGATVVKFYAQIFPHTVASLVLINPFFEGLFVGDKNPWTTHWYTNHLPALQLRHITAALGLTRIGLQTSLLLSPLNLKTVPENIKNRQKYLVCKPGHISSVIEENYFLNESLSQAR